MSQAEQYSNHDAATVLLAAQRLRCIRGDITLFDELDLVLTEGKCIHIIGTNGSGKTSLLRILCGLNRADFGDVTWQGESISLNSQYHSDMAYLGHKDGLKNELTAFENLHFQQCLESCIDDDSVDDCLAQLEILHCAELPAQALSFGQRRRLAFARLLLLPKRLWILDEPLTGIDASGRKLIEGLCVKHLQEGGSIIMTHHQSLADSALGDLRQELHLGTFAAKQRTAI